MDARTLPPTAEVKHIACLMLAGIGDILAATPTINALKQRYPEARITAITRTRLAPLLGDQAAVDEVIGYGRGLGGRLGFFRKLRQTRFDLWIDLHAPTFHTVSSANKVFLRNAIIVAAARTRYRLGFAAPILRSLLTHAVPVADAAEQAKTNIVDTTLSLLPAEIPTVRRKTLDISAEQQAWAQTQLGDAECERYAFFFGGRQSASHWPVSRATAFAQLLLERKPDARLLLLGDIHERAMADNLIANLPAALHERIDDKISAANFAETAALFAQCTGAVCSDSGPMHIAEASGVPLVALFSSKNHVAVWEPVAPNARVLNYNVDCAPCFLATCPIENRCMNMIEPEEAYDALMAVTAG